MRASHSGFRSSAEREHRRYSRLAGPVPAKVVSERLRRVRASCYYPHPHRQEVPVMNKSRILSAASLVSLLLVLAACGSEQKPADPPPAAEQPYQREIDKARGVEQTL